MGIGFHGQVQDGPQVRAGFIGCGSHAFRNIYPTFQFTPVDLVATCDLQVEKARAFAAQFGAGSAYADFREMLDDEDLDAVFIVTGYDEAGRPLYPRLAVECLQAGCHVWIEKPPAASCREIDSMRDAAREAGRHVMVGFKKMFVPANEKAAQLMREEGFGALSLIGLHYPQFVPEAGALRAYLAGERVDSAVGFLDHLCHPVSLLLHLAGVPATVFYERSAGGGGFAVFRYASGAVASLCLVHGASANMGMERTVIIGDGGGHVVVENNLRLYVHRSPSHRYGASPDYYGGGPEDASAVWEPEFSLGQLYNKGLFLLGYYGEVNEFARSVLEDRPPRKGTLEQAWQATRIFEAFAEGPGKVTPLAK